MGQEDLFGQTLALRRKLTYARERFRREKGTETRGLEERKVVCGAKERASVAE
jgi:hypothetical protein